MSVSGPVSELASAATNSDLSTYGPTVTPGAAGRLLVVSFAWGRTSNLTDAWTSIGGTLSVEDEDGNPGWTEIASVAVSNNNARIAAFYAYSTSTASGTVVLNFPAAQGNGSWKVVEYPGATVGQARVDLANVATLQSAAVDPSISLPTALRSGSAVHAVIGNNNTSNLIYEPGDYTEIGGRLTTTTPTVSHTAAYNVTPSGGTVAWTVAGTTAKALVAFEIFDYVAPGGGPALTWWDGSTEVALSDLAWWDGSTEVPVTDLELWPG